MMTKICTKCGNEYQTERTKQRVCNDCQRETELRAKRKENIKRKKPKVENKYIKPAKSIRQVIKEIEEYNKANGTNLTYGQYTLYGGKR